MLLPPGLGFLFARLPNLLWPPVVTYAISYFTAIPTSLRIVACILSTPCYIAFEAYKSSRAHHHQLATRGAQDVPVWPGKWPGNLDILLQLVESWKCGYLGDVIDDAFEGIGATMRFSILGDDEIFTYNPQNIKTILVTDFDGYEKGERMMIATQSVLGRGVFNVDGDMWKFHRGMTRMFFTKDRISDLNTLCHNSDSAIALAKSRFRQGGEIDIQDLFSRVTLDTATSFLLGSSVNSLSANLPSSDGTESLVDTSAPSPDSFSRAFASVQRKVGARLWIGPDWPLAEMFRDVTIEDNAVIDKFVWPIIKSALAMKEQNKPAKNDGTDDDETLLSHLVSQTDDLQLIRDEIVNILIAGRDTTTSTLTFATYCLSRNPQAAIRLREEILGKLGPLSPPTYDDMKAMSYTRAVINETLRLFPPVPFNVRETTRDTTWPAEKSGEKPYFIKAKTAICFSVWFMHRSTELWGPDAMVFDPDRFIDERLGKYLTPNPHIFLPFNAGPRLCLGREFAYNQISFALIRFFQTFDPTTIILKQPPSAQPPAAWKSAENVARGKAKAYEDIWPQSHFTLYVKGGLWVTMKENQDVEN
ncbi:cytochrome P450 [Rickenella mellea]|uniref:Cytochrome P450 n=1 Tax=Rickenella mellea TaxID=50990 RepID=A0A4R5XFH8_9AGAM|nr:cytochrome P450 [Rickenella mellea]